jgi:hypothetical protein
VLAVLSIAPSRLGAALSLARASDSDEIRHPCLIRCDTLRGIAISCSDLSMMAACAAIMKLAMRLRRSGSEAGSVPFQSFTLLARLSCSATL